MYMYSWDTKIWCFNSLWCNSLLPPCQQGAFFFCVERTKRLWHDCLSSFNLGNRIWTRCKSNSLNYLPSGRNSRCHTNLLCREIWKAKLNHKFWCEIRIVCIGKNILPNYGIMWEAKEQPRRSSHDPKPFRLASWALNDSNSFCRIWIWAAWAWSTSLLSALCSIFLTFLLELPLLGKAWVDGWSALAFGWRVTEDAGRFCCGNQSCFHFGNLAKQITSWCPSFPQ
jgi:hypothetical protein